MRKDWEIKKLSDVAAIFNGNSINAKVKEAKYTNIDSGLPFIATKDVGFDSCIDYENGVKIPFNEKDSFKIAPEDTVLICAEGGSAGRKIGFTNQEVCFGNKLFATVPKNGLLGRFAYYYYFSSDFQQNFSTELAGIIGGVSMAKFKQIQIPIPPLPEQKRIVSILDQTFAAIDKAKANAEQNLNNAKELFESYLWQSMSDKQWKKVKLQDICTNVEYGSSSKSLLKGNIPVLRMGNIQGGKFDWTDLVYTDNEEEIEKYTLKYNDVLFNRTNSPELVGKTAIYKGEQPAIFAGYLIRIHRKEDLIDADYLNFFLNSILAKNYGEKVMSASINQANINGTKLKTYPVPLPSLSKQKEIVQGLVLLQKETQNLQAVYCKKLLDIDELKKSILHKVFNGEL